MPTSAPVLSAVASNGDGTFTILGSNFGSKAQAAPILYDHTDSVWENGVENTRQASFPDGQIIQRVADDPGTIWHKPYLPDENSSGMVVSRSRPKRHPMASAQYYGNGPNSALGWPSASGGEANGIPGDKTYVAFWLKLPFNLSKYWAIPADENTASFVLNGQYEYGENLLIDGAVKGRVMHYYPVLGSVPHGWLFAEFNDDVSTNYLIGKTLVGEASGTLLQFPATASAAGFDDDGFISPRGKYLRLWSASAGDEWRFSIANLGCSANVGTLFTNKFGSKYPIPGQWNHFEVELDKGRESPKLRVTLNNEIYLESNEEFEANISGSAINSPQFATIALLGIDDFMAVPFEADFSDIYLDNSFSRVYLADAPVWADVRHKELQRPVSWSGGEIVVSRFDGSLGAGKWVYVVGPNGMVNANGVQAP